MNTKQLQQASFGLSKVGIQTSNCKKLSTITTERTSIYASLCNRSRRRKMKVKSAINMQGEVLSIATTATMITLVKGEQFNAEMADTTGVLVDDEPMTLAAARRKWMHDKLDAWIDEVSNE